MRTASGALKTLLANGSQFLLADCLTLIPVSGSTVRLTNADHDIVVASRYPNLTSPATQTFAMGGQGIGPTFTRGTTKLVTGVEVDRSELVIEADPDNDTFAGSPWPEAARLGAFDGATVVIEKVVTASWSDLSAGTFVIFWGHVGAVTPYRNAVHFEILSELDYLQQQQVPRNLYQPGCLHTLYDAGCTLDKATFAVTGTAGIGSTGIAIVTGLADPDGYFSQGLITFTSGALSGITRTVKGYTGGTATLVVPLPSAPAPGDGFTIYPGCDKQQATCSAKFSNLDHFRGFPYIPDPVSGM